MTDQDQVSILVVAAKEQNLELVSQFLYEQDYQPVMATSLSDLDQLLAQETECESKIGLAIVDADGFDTGIWDRCKQLRTASISFLLLSLNASSLQRKGLEYGARSVLKKPIAKQELTQLIQTLVTNS